MYSNKGASAFLAARASQARVRIIYWHLIGSREGMSSGVVGLANQVSVQRIYQNPQTNEKVMVLSVAHSANGTCRVTFQKRDRSTATLTRTEFLRTYPNQL